MLECDSDLNVTMCSVVECDRVIYMQQCVQYVSVIELSICNKVYSMLESDRVIYIFTKHTVW